MKTLQPGENITVPATRGHVLVTHDLDDTLDVNLTAFVLDADGRAAGDEAVVFFNQNAHATGAAHFVAPVSAAGVRTHRLDFALHPSAAAGSRIAVTLTEDAGRGFAAARGLRAEVHLGGEVLTLSPREFSTEKGVIILELYWRQDHPKLKAVWQGFSSGLAGLCKHYGIEVADAPAAAAPAPAAAPVPTPSRISLTKPEQSHKISLRKDAGSPAEIQVQAIWTDNGDGNSDNDDLDLRVGILLPDGRMSIVQAPERSGAFAKAPYVFHTGDVKQASANAPGVESVRVNPGISQHLGGPVALVFSVYSAVDNGVVSVASLKPRMRMVYGDQVVECAFDFSAKKKGFFSRRSNDNDVYTYVIGLIEIDRDSVVIKPSGQTSANGSEDTPWLTRQKDGSVSLTIDGPPVFKGEPLEPRDGKAYV